MRPCLARALGLSLACPEADWKRRGVGNSAQEALLKQFLQLQTRAVLRPLLLSTESEVNPLMVATHTPSQTTPAARRNGGGGRRGASCARPSPWRSSFHGRWC